MKTPTKFRYILNGGQSQREFVCRVFGKETISFLEATIDGFNAQMSISITSDLGNRLTISKED